jgi:RsiW-degrading membrane proteinase PrsW (M82 family)
VFILLSVIIPCIPIALMLWWVTHNKIRPLPLKGTGMRVFLLGGAGAVVVMIIFGFILDGLNQAIAKSDVILFKLLDDWLLSAIPEEAVKVFAVVLGAKMMKRLRYSTDVILYAALAALGFAFVETLGYALNDLDLFSMIMRAVKSVPGHVLFSCVIAISYLQFLKTGNKRQVAKGFLLASVLHGFGNFCLFRSSDTDSAFAYFYLFLGIPFTTVMIYVILYRVVKNFRLASLNHGSKDIQEGVLQE